MKKIIIFILIPSIFLFSCTKNENKEINKYYKTTIVSSSGNLSSNFNTFIGYTKGIKQVMLATKSAGRITYLNKNIGDKVYSGELLANLDSSEAKAGYSSANNITNNLILLKENTAKAIDEQIKAMQAKIEQAKASLKGTTNGVNDIKNITDSQIKTAQTNLKQAILQLETAKTNLRQTQNTLKTKELGLLSGAKTAIIQSVILYENVIDFSDKLLGITPLNEDFNDTFDDYLGKKDIKQFNLTKNTFINTKKIFDNYKKYYEKYIENKNPSKEEIINGLEKAEKVAEQEKILLKEINTVIDNSIENVYFNSNTINKYKNKITTLGSNIENSLLNVDGIYTVGIKGAFQNINDFDSESEKAITLLKKQISLAEAGVETAKQAVKQYETMGVGKINDISTKKEIANKTLKEALAELEALKAKKQATLKELDAKIAESKGGKLEASVMIENGKIIAPFSGIIIKKTAEIGQIVSPGMPIYEIANTNKIKVIVSIDSQTKKTLIIGEKINIEIENIEKNFIGEIINISKSQDPITKKYNIEILIDNKNLEIPVGSMAKVRFNIKDNLKKNNTIIPNKAIISNFMIPGVYIIENNKIIFKNIKILKMGDNYSEVSGIKNGDIIVIEGQENLYDEEILN